MDLYEASNKITFKYQWIKNIHLKKIIIINK